MKAWVMAFSQIKRVWRRVLKRLSAIPDLYSKSKVLYEKLLPMGWGMVNREGKSFKMAWVTISHTRLLICWKGLVSRENQAHNNSFCKS